MRDWLTKSEDCQVIFYEVRKTVVGGARTLYCMLRTEDLEKAPVQKVRKVFRHLNFEAEEPRLACLETTATD